MPNLGLVALEEGGNPNPNFTLHFTDTHTHTNISFLENLFISQNWDINKNNSAVRKSKHLAGEATMLFVASQTADMLVRVKYSCFWEQS